VVAWRAAWRESGRAIVLLDFVGTLAPIVARPELAELPPDARAAIDALRSRGAEVAVVSGRALADVRERARLDGIVYAGNHGMEIDGPGVHRIHAEAAAARPALERAAHAIARDIDGTPGAFVEDKGLTLSVHFRLTPAEEVPVVREQVRRAVATEPVLRVTEGKMVLEVRPAVEWDKGRAVRFLLDALQPAAGVPVLYLGDDRTDEDAFRALREWRAGAAEGVIIAEAPPEHTAATAYLHSPAEVAALLARLAEPA
jgi:trehalose-phosphatase